MDSSLGSSFMAVFAVSGSVVLLAMQVHKRLLSNFMKKMEFEIKKSPAAGTVKSDETKKRVRFSDDANAESTANRKASGKKQSSRPAGSNRVDGDENLDAMPQNWQVMYKGILQYRNLRGSN